MRELVFAGFGGQGVLTAGLIISQIALYKKYNATWMPSYGAAMRGGTANCTVHYGAGKIFNPGQQAPDLLLAMNTPSFLKFSPLVRSGGIILANEDIVEFSRPVPEGVRVVKIPCNTLAEECGSPKGANIVMIGAIVALLGDFSHDEGVAGMNDMFRKKGKEKFEQANTRAFEAGYRAVLELKERS